MFWNIYRDKYELFIRKKRAVSMVTRKLFPWLQENCYHGYKKPNIYVLYLVVNLYKLEAIELFFLYYKMLYHLLKKKKFWKREIIIYCTLFVGQKCCRYCWYKTWYIYYNFTSVRIGLVVARSTADREVRGSNPTHPNVNFPWDKKLVPKNTLLYNVLFL